NCGTVRQTPAMRPSSPAATSGERDCAKIEPKAFEARPAARSRERSSSTLLLGGKVRPWKNPSDEPYGYKAARSTRPRDRAKRVAHEMVYRCDISFRSCTRGARRFALFAGGIGGTRSKQRTLSGNLLGRVECGSPLTLRRTRDGAAASDRF